MITTTYTCDVCGHAQSTEDQMWTVHLKVIHGTVAINPYTTSDHTRLLCRPCICRTGFWGEKLKQEAQPPVPIPSAEQVFIDALMQFIDERVSERGTR